MSGSSPPISITCKECGTPFSYTQVVAGGRPRQYCDQCRDAGHGNRKLAHEVRAETRSAGTGITPAERLAIGMAIDPDPARACEIVGVSARGEELEELAIEARTRYPDLCAGKLSALNAQIHSALALAVLRMREQATILSPGSTAASVKALVQALESLSGGVQRVYSEVTVILPEGH